MAELPSVLLGPFPLVVKRVRQQHWKPVLARNATATLRATDSVREWVLTWEQPSNPPDQANRTGWTIVFPDGSSGPYSTGSSSLCRTTGHGATPL